MAGHALQLLSCLIPIVYGTSRQGHTHLGVVYDMVLSHSKFFHVLSSCDQPLKGKWVDSECQL